MLKAFSTLFVVIVIISLGSFGIEYFWNHSIKQLFGISITYGQAFSFYVMTSILTLSPFSFLFRNVIAPPEEIVDEETPEV